MKGTTVFSPYLGFRISNLTCFVNRVRNGVSCDGAFCHGRTNLLVNFSRSGSRKLRWPELEYIRTTSSSPPVIILRTFYLSQNLPIINYPSILLSVTLWYKARTTLTHSLPCHLSGPKPHIPFSRLRAHPKNAVQNGQNCVNCFTSSQTQGGSCHDTNSCHPFSCGEIK